MDTTSTINVESSHPVFKNQTCQLIAECKKLSQADLSKLMDISDKIATLNHSRFQQFESSETKQALLSYNGDVFKQLEKTLYTESDWGFAQEHLLIVSGLYGLLRPLDLIAPYRLEMAIKLQSNNSNNLYDFWQKELTNFINISLAKHKSQYLLNLASNEYSKVVKNTELNYPIITIDFKQRKGDKIETIGVLAKKARGQMLNFIIKNHINTPTQLLDFCIDNYQYQPDLSSNSNLVFLTNIT
jgi:cytoplasmic iron level regulating protein YaaA (DUF328/UPF0246 family)